MFAGSNKQRISRNRQMKNYTAPGKKILPEKGKLLFRKISKLFKRIKIDQKVLKETLEITFWK